MSQQHTHKYYRVILKKRSKSNVPTGEDYVVYKCALPGCTHYVARILANNRNSICWQCKEEFTLSMKHLRYKRPRCNKCMNKTSDKQVNNNDKDILDEVLGNLFS